MTYLTKYSRATRSLAATVLTTVLLATAGCKSLDVPNLNGVGEEDLLVSPTRDAVLAATQSLISTWRSTTSGHAATLAKYGYEIWQARASEPRTLTNVHRDPQSGGFWGYGGVKNADLVISSVDKVAAFTAAEREAIKGFAKTVLAVLYEDMIQAHDTLGIVLDLPANPLTDVPAIATKAQSWARVFQLLNEAHTHMGAAGTSFPFLLHAGFTGFNTPTTFRRVIRSLQARYMVLSTPTCDPACPGNAGWTAVLTLLNGTETIINTGASGLTFAGLHAGPYHIYGSPDATNSLSRTDGFANDRIRVEAQCATAGECSASPRTAGDARAFGATAKVRTVSTFSLLGMQSSLKQTDLLNPSQAATIGTTAPLPIIRNEELILLRAEANVNLGNNSAAIADLNLIRVNRAGLPPLSDPYVPVAALNQAPTLVDALLYEKRYSLWGEIGTVWLDMRRYPPGPNTPAPPAGAAPSRLWEVPVSVTGWKLFDVFPIPTSECEVRGYSSTKGCFEGGYPGFVGPRL